MEGKCGAWAVSCSHGEPTALCRGPQPAAQVGIGAVVAICFGVVTLLTAKGSNDHAAGVARPGELGIHPSPVKPNMFYGTRKRRSVNNSFVLVKLWFCFMDSEIIFGDHLLLLYCLVYCD